MSASANTLINESCTGETESISLSNDSASSNPSVRVFSDSQSLALIAAYNAAPAITILHKTEIQSLTLPHSKPLEPENSTLIKANVATHRSTMTVATNNLFHRSTLTFSTRRLVHG